MGSNVRSRKSRKRKYVNSTVHSKKLKKKMAIKKVPLLSSVSKTWKNAQTLKQNMNAIGIAYDPNEVVPLKGISTPESPALKTTESQCLKDLKDEAAACGRARKLTLSKSERKVYSQLMEKYGENFKKMVQDKRNVNQLTENQLRRKCSFLSN